MAATIKYKGSTIATVDADATKVLKTGGKYCEGDIVVENVRDGNPNSRKYIVTVDSDQTGTFQLTTITDSDVLAHRSDEFASVLLEALFDVGTSGVSWFLTKNRHIGTSGNSVGLRYKDGVLGLISSTLGITASSSIQNGQVEIDADGKIYTRGSENVPIKAGTYSITISW